jgi:hypothetical protein
MRVEFSSHALQKIRQRKLSRARILQTLAHSDFREPGYGGREAWFKDFGKNNLLKVVIMKRPDILIVVTAHWVAKKPKKY